ncbi:hypothetical protein PAL_GLEAN10004688 [Pteropus alecto]|uniref:Uncharacterized protein n=1 Tax=Pteropus alecto TaxID=9402 RepID=L5L1D1_PTEAL|nr:hypothetical protein PAL_GLEAN10004688 [Pteropus alecto]
MIPRTFLTSHLKGKKETRPRETQFAAHADLREDSYVARGEDESIPQPHTGQSGHVMHTDTPLTR